jgi:hypothetical protein
MMRLRRASMIAALPLLAWTATSSAECAWVVWEHRVTHQPARSPQKHGHLWRLLTSAPTATES